ncbi:hypothetical protein BH11PSE13_BH11PSE13_20740 [soil metagenome]
MFAVFLKAWNAMVSLDSGDRFWQSREDAYLAEAVDNNDLERRMRELEHRPRFG